MTSNPPADLLPSLLAGVVVYQRDPWGCRTQDDFLRGARSLSRKHRCPITLARRGASEDGIVLDFSGDEGELAEREDLDLLVWDDRVRELERSRVFVLRVRATSSASNLELIDGLLRRYQRLLPLPSNEADPSALARMIALHRSLHDSSRPLVRADYDHSVDTWRWLLHLAPKADLPLQCAALFHDIERLESEAVRRTEHLESDYVAFKVAHARRGAEIVTEHADRIGLTPEEAGDVSHLVSNHERPNAEPRLQLLNDADGLSFFTLNSYGYLRYFGPSATRAKIRYTLSRLSPRARVMALASFLHPRVRELLDVEVSTSVASPGETTARLNGGGR